MIIVLKSLLLLCQPRSQQWRPNLRNYVQKRIPKFLNVISKFPFLIISLIGLILCFYPEDYFSFSLRGEKIGWTCFYIGVTAVAFGSSYYHLHPNDAALLWDPLPFVPCILIPLMAILLPPMYTHSAYWLWACLIFKLDNLSVVLEIVLVFENCRTLGLMVNWWLITMLVPWH
ncbi:hypothetical protein ARALYDRAFT_917393 [Arabidopsis lyrata subsp. lyrata]|uniref:Uncharacterized protein n=1 Tax=Arabidopsis lyrata subsp. lyrata TaxID=81972 RepID=D7MQ26_ARALL|nr:hypothetical protein ARALYDRAFT_917393 [Arabidopsis lyrata subsp. lyrata]